MKRIAIVSVLSVVVACVAVAPSLCAVSASLVDGDSDGDGITDAREANLASLYSPALQFSRGEKFYPAPVEYFISNSFLKRTHDGTVTTVSLSPTVPMLGALTDAGDGYFLENTLGGFDEIASDYQARRESLGYVVYARVYPDQSAILSNVVVQYWMFYVFNNGPLNDHQGDWEMIEVVLDASDAPLYAGYSQHFSGERTDWQNVEKRGGTHPVVYVAEGSHANYFRVVQGRLGLESDVVAADGPLLEPSVLTLTLLGEESPGLHLDAHRWLTYAGRWGDIGGEMDELAGRNGPLGPVYNSDGRKWHTPVVWALNLFLVDTTWFTASLLVANFNWIFLGVVGLFGGWKCWNIYRAASKKELVLGSLLRSKVSVGIGLGVVGLALTLAGMFLPWFTFSVNIPTGKFATQGPVNIIYLDGLNGLRINLLDASEGAMQLGGVGVSFSMIILVWLTFSFLDLIGTRNGKVLGRQHITSGIYNLIPIAVIVLFIMQFAMVVTSFAGAATGSVPLEARIIGDLISSSPMSGSYTGEIGAYGTASLSWGLGLGAYLLLIAGLVKIAAGSIIRVTSPPPKPQSKP